MTGFPIPYEWGKDQSGRLEDQLFLNSSNHPQLLAIQQVKTLASKQATVKLIVKRYSDFN
tara:strand:- start:465 stop:644 length:180 start_codon:yes stop_codon:yes gene_type:complete